VINRKLIQIIFFIKDIIRFGQRFIADKVLTVDDTFNTNKLRMLLFVEVEITNFEKFFFQIYSYCPGETAKLYEFFFKVLREEIFVNNILDSAVVMRDQAAGLIKIINILKTVFNNILQFCN
jgi:hypothetical protein